MLYTQGRDVRSEIEKVKERFLEIKNIIGDDFSMHHLDDSAFVSRLAEAVEEAYIELNEEMCEELEVCHTCAQNRDNLREIMVMLDDIESGATITDAIGDHFMAYSLELDSVITRIDGVLEKI